MLDLLDDVLPRRIHDAQWPYKERPMHRHLLVCLVTPLALATAACGDAVGPAPTHPITQTEKRGTRLSRTDESWIIGTAWSPDQRWVYYAAYADTGGYAHLSRVASSGGEASEVDLDGHHVLAFPSSGLGNVVSAENGVVYAVVSTDDSVSFTGVMRVLPDTSPERIPALNGARGIRLAPGEKHLVYGTLQTNGDLTLRLQSYDLAADTSISLGIGTALAFSPDGTQLLYMTDDEAYVIADLATGATQEVDLGLGSDYPERLVWPSDGIQVFFRHGGASHPSYFVHDVTAGTTTQFYDGGLDATLIWPETWSVDGSRFAITAWKCLEVTGLLSCGSSVDALYVLGVPSGSETSIATVHDADIRAVEFSPDGSRVLYSINGDLYVSLVPAT